MQTAKHSNLKETWAAFKEANPKTRIRNAAEELGVSEAELLATGCGETCTRLLDDKGKIPALLAELKTLGKVMALTRNDAAVHEVSNTFGEIKQNGQTASAFRPGQDTRYFLEHWHYTFAVNENDRRSLQFFDQYGEALHKIYLVEDSNLAAYEALIERYQSPQQTPELTDIQRHTEQSEKADITVDITDVTTLKQQWAAIQDVHEASRIIREHGGNAQAVYQALGEDYARLLTKDSVIEDLLNHLVFEEQECMIFVRNHGAVQSYAGPLHRLLRTGPWFNVLDPGFNLHLRTDLIAAVWKVTKPSSVGEVNSVVVFDKDGQEILLITDNRKRDTPESAGWRTVLELLG